MLASQINGMTGYGKRRLQFATIAMSENKPDWGTE
jgi:hypothetical protein